MLIIFSHGKESGPWGSKIKTLADIAENLGYNIDSIDYSGMSDPDARVEKLKRVLEGSTQDVILVGSSMGGYVSLVAAQSHAVRGLFLLAPALYMKDYSVQEYKPLTSSIYIVHGLSDDVIPYSHSQRFADEKTDCNLQLVEGDHRLNSSLKLITPMFEVFLNKADGLK
jgi:predicted esterase YcpF (UPF0227 family)